MKRKEYHKHRLSRKDLNENPFSQFELWFKEAAAIPEANAMQLSTATLEGKPSCRTVLLKQFSQKGFVFYTNHESRKGRELSQNPNAFALFLWKELERQVCLEGPVERISREEAEKYFFTRPRGAQISATASKQDAIIPSREFLEAAYAEVEKAFDGKQLPLPSFWGGYRLIPKRFEFWQGRKNRLHDRFQYRCEGEKWLIERLSP
jgi:pyridoxamine 5'-phosphate oxidase